MVPTGAQMLLSMLGIDAKKIAELFDAINKDDVLGLLDRIKGLVERIEEIDRRTERLERAICARELAAIDGSCCACGARYSDGRSASHGNGTHAIEAADRFVAIVAADNAGDFHAAPAETVAPANREHV